MNEDPTRQETTTHPSEDACLIKPMSEIERHDTILDAISFIAETFLKDNDIETNIQTTLERLGNATSVSRVYIFENHQAADGTLLMSQRYEWAAEGISTEIDNPDLQNLSYLDVGFDRWIPTMQASKPIYGSVSTFPDAERAILEPQDILFIVVVPIFVGTQWWGFIGFDECVCERYWSEIEIRALMAAATIMGSAVRRRKDEHERLMLQQQMIDAQQAAIRELSTPLIPLSDHVVLMPLIGSVDTLRAQQVMEVLLEGIATHHADTAILDITGVSVVDTQVANAIIQAAQAVKLLGAQVVLTGIGPSMAQTLVNLGIDLNSLTTRGSLQQAIAWALKR